MISFPSRSFAFLGTHADRAIEGHHTSLPNSDLHVSEGSPHNTEASDNESVMSGDLTLHQNSWSEYNRPQEVGLDKPTPSIQPQRRSQESQWRGVEEVERPVAPMPEVSKVPYARVRVDLSALNILHASIIH